MLGVRLKAAGRVTSLSRERLTASAITEGVANAGWDVTSNAFINYCKSMAKLFFGRWL
jgi:hypothetical protein